MRIARIIGAVLIALSVALLPAAGGAAFKLKSQDITETSGSETEHDCCPPGSDPCDMAVDGCGSMATCALKCFSFAAGLASPLTDPWTLASRLPVLEDHGLRSHTGSPPFRPPRL
jgi:hypothetical protein